MLSFTDFLILALGEAAAFCFACRRAVAVASALLLTSPPRTKAWMVKAAKCLANTCWPCHVVLVGSLLCVLGRRERSECIDRSQAHSIVYFGTYFAYLVKENAGGKEASMPRKSKKRCMRNWARLVEDLTARCRRRNFSFLEEEGGVGGVWRIGEEAKQNGEILLGFFSHASDTRVCSFNNQNPAPPLFSGCQSARAFFSGGTTAAAAAATVGVGGISQMEKEEAGRAMWQLQGSRPCLLAWSQLAKPALHTPAYTHIDRQNQQLQQQQLGVETAAGLPAASRVDKGVSSASSDATSKYIADACPSHPFGSLHMPSVEPG